MTGKRNLTWLVLTGVLATAGCNGGSTGSPGGGAPGDVAAGPATVKGAVQSTSGALVVNGVAFRTSGAAIRDDGGPAATLSGGEAELRGRVAEGEVVTVRGRVDDGGRSGQAAEIEVHHAIAGELQARGPGQLVVGGAVVSVDDSTRVTDRSGNPAVSDDLLGQRVEVSGHGDGRGGIRATSVRGSASSSTERELRAFVVAVSGSVVDLSFSPGGAVAIRVDVSGVSPSPSVTVGTFVEVHTAGPANAGGVYTATAIHPEDDLSPRPSDRVELEGIVTAVDGSGFDIGSQRVVLAASARLRGGTIDDLVVGVGVEAEGVLRDDGVLEASELNFRPSARIEANAAAIDASAGTFELLGLAVHVTPSTELKDLPSLAALPAGADVEVRGNPTADGAGVNATRVELRSTSPSDRAFLRGVASEKTPTSSLRILGLAVNTTAAEFRDHSDAGLSAAAFFDAITAGETIVKVRWRPYPASTSEPVDEAELESD